MQKVITVNLNGHAYQLEESGYDILRDYLDRAAADLAGNPDRAEIIADLEQAVADKCQRFLGPHKSVITAGEVEQIVAELGPVDAAPGEASAGSAGAAAPGSATPPKRLYRIPEGAMIAGVCKGVAAYFALDVAIVRVGFALTALLTQGAGIIAYVVMMFVMPEAKTPDERAAAAGGPFNARDVVERARRQAADGAKRARVSWRRQQRQWRRYGAAHAPAPGLGVVVLPLFGLVQFVLFFIMIAVLVSLVNTGEVLGWELDPDVPVWAAALIVLVAYQILASPFRAVQQWYAHAGEGQPAAYAFWNAVISLVALAAIVWIASDHIPEIREFLRRLPDVVRDFIWTVRDAIS
jgi:phage shock protein PspC (stress-responsive transcriptional regulator)